MVSATLSMVAGGAVQQMVYTGEMMAMTMHGLSLLCYDRATGKWQQIWVDNFAGNMTMYYGTYEDGKCVMQGTGLMEGQEVHTRVTTIHDSADSMTWQMENSTDGKSWWVSMKGTYTRTE